MRDEEGPYIFGNSELKHIFQYIIIMKKYNKNIRLGKCHRFSSPCPFQNIETILLYFWDTFGLPSNSWINFVNVSNSKSKSIRNREPSAHSIYEIRLIIVEQFVNANVYVLPEEKQKKLRFILKTFQTKVHNICLKIVCFSCITFCTCAIFNVTMIFRWA